MPNDSKTQPSGWLSKAVDKRLASAMSLKERLSIQAREMASSLFSPLGLIAIAGIVIAAHIVPAFLESMLSTVEWEHVRDYLAIVLPLQGVIVGVVFVAIFFTSGALHRDRQFDVSFVEGMKAMGLVPLSCLMLASIIGAVAAAFETVILSEHLDLVGAGNVAVVTSVFLFATAGAAGWILWQTFRTLDPSEVFAFNAKLAERLAEDEAIRHLRVELTREALDAVQWIGGGSILFEDGLASVETKKRGRVTDLHIGKLEAAGIRMEEAAEGDADRPQILGSLTVTIGVLLTDDDHTIAKIERSVDSQKIRRMLEKSIKVRNRFDSGTSDHQLFRTLNQLYERTLVAIESDDRETLDTTLDLYLRMLNSQLGWLARFDRILGPDELRLPFARTDMPKPYEAIFHRFRRVLARTLADPDSRCFASALYWPVELWALGRRTGHFKLSRDALELFIFAYDEAVRVERPLTMRAIIDAWRDAPWGPERFVVDQSTSVVRDREIDDEVKLQQLNHVRQVFNTLATMSCISVYHGDQNSFGHLLASWSNMSQHLYWPLDQYPEEYGREVVEMKRVLEAERLRSFTFVAGLVSLQHHVYDGWNRFFPSIMELANRLERNYLGESVTQLKVWQEICELDPKMWPDWVTTFLTLGEIPMVKVNERLIWVDPEDLPAWFLVVARSMNKREDSGFKLQMPNADSFQVQTVAKAIEQKFSNWEPTLNKDAIVDLAQRFNPERDV